MCVCFKSSFHDWKVVLMGQFMDYIHYLVTQGMMKID